MDDDKFISEVQKYPVLYDMANPFYKDNYRKEAAWSAVATAVGSKANDCRTRWRQLRDSFVKHKKKTALTGSSQKDWKYAEEMAFLIPFLKHRSSKHYSGLMPPLEAEESEEGGVGETSEAPLAILQLPATPAPVEPERVARSHSQREREQRSGQETRKRTAQVSDFEDSLPSGRRWQEAPPKPEVPNTEQDEAYHFALSIVPLLLNLNKTRRRRAKWEIMKVLDLLNEEEEGEQLAASHLGL